jgi:hypothetical protein
MQAAYGTNISFSPDMETTRNSFHSSNSLHSEKEKWTERFARFGIISKGVVYCLIGVLTTMAALGLRGGDKASKNDAFKTIYDQPFGKILLIIVAIGLFGYVTWRFFQSVYDIDSKGNDTKAKFVRIGYGVSALLYLVIAIYAMKLALAGPGGNEDGSQQFVVAKILNYPAGEWIIGIAGLLTIGNGIRQIYKAISGNFMKNIQLIHSRHSDFYKKSGVAGYISRGIVLLIIGYFFLRAALHHNANEAIGTKEAFSFLENTFGTVLMGIVALGLVGYGVFMFVKGRYQKIDLNF